MELTFYKYQGTGNDFVMVDNRNLTFPKNDTILVKRLCDRKFGIGADGLILLEYSPQYGLDFEMVYFNSDGNESSMCGNGGRCLIAFANFLGLVQESCRFNAVDGVHEGTIAADGRVGLKMNNVSEINNASEYTFLNTGSPHHVIFSENVTETDVKRKGAEIRYSELYKEKGGTNINFVQVLDSETLKIRTYERGVEDETLSCGTGATAAAIAAFATGKLNTNSVALETEGGRLLVRFKNSDNGFSEIWLEGPAVQVFKGTIIC